MTKIKTMLLSTVAAVPMVFGVMPAIDTIARGVWTIQSAHGVPSDVVRSARSPELIDAIPAGKALASSSDVAGLLNKPYMEHDGRCNPCAVHPAPTGNPCALENACNPCAAAAGACNPCGASGSASNPCAAIGGSCNPCAAARMACRPSSPHNPCAAANPCALAIPEVPSSMSVEEIVEALKAPPKRSVGKVYSLDEIERQFEVRDLFQAVEVKSLGFAFNSTAVKGMEAGYLGNIAMAIQNILEERPHEIFFIEGHADAAGPEDYNLALSKQRALQVKSALVNVFGLPERNIMAGGFGEKHLKVSTQRPEQANRRVTVRCITPLVHTAVTD